MVGEQRTEASGQSFEDLVLHQGNIPTACYTTGGLPAEQDRPRDTLETA